MRPGWLSTGALGPDVKGPSHDRKMRVAGSETVAAAVAGEHPGAPSRHRRGGLVEQRQVDQRPDDASGDYEYDQAHEHPAAGPHGHYAQGPSGPVPAARRPPEPDGD